MPQELYGPQVELVKKYRPPAVVIAGGQPAQAKQFEAEGIPTFIHVPSHRLLDLYLDEGTRNVIFEGLECGGHIGRYSGFVLWENVIEVLLARIPRDGKGGRCGALFAGGISTALSGAMVSAIVAPLADRTVDVGVLVGTGYLFTREAVECGAINAGFQGAILAARRTAILDCGGGYQIRAAPNPFCDAFEEEKQRLIAQGLPAEEVRMSLEHLTLGRLRIAAKGLRFNEKRRQDPTQPLTLEVPEPEQQRDGVYMAGQAILLHDSVYSVADLHRRISEESVALLRASDEAIAQTSATSAASDMEIAIVGMSGLFPGASDLDTYWAEHPRRQVQHHRGPRDRWNLDLYFDADPKSRDKIYSRWGGFLDPIEFDPLKFGMPPKAVGSIDPFQLLTLELVDRALRDSGYDERWFDREHTSVFVGEAGGGNLGQLYCLRSLLPMILRDVPEAGDGAAAGVDGGLLPGAAAERDRRACGQPVRPGRHQPVHLGGLRRRAGRALAGHGRPALGQEPHVDRGRGRRGAEPVRLHVVLQDDGPVAHRHPALLRRNRRRHRDQPGRRRGDPEAAGGRASATAIGSTRSCAGWAAPATGAARASPHPPRRDRCARSDAPTSRRASGWIRWASIEAHGTGTVLGDRTEAETITLALREAGAPAKSCAVGSSSR